MDNDLDELVVRIDKFVLERDWEQFHNAKNLVTSISIEAAELCEIIQWSNPSWETLAEDDAKVLQFGEELSDVMIYCLRLCSMLDLDPLSIMHDKISKNERKYPVELSRGKSTKYSDLRNDEA